jgi:hypothetical protein
MIHLLVHIPHAASDLETAEVTSVGRRANDSEAVRPFCLFAIEPLLWFHAHKPSTKWKTHTCEFG